ncbi:MAG: PqqD family peptide modification chaperone [Desulfobacteraceae bacterium]|nr:PqqD family peptide modification chaperone [Desulfobacteraceae bacterium]
MLALKADTRLVLGEDIMIQAIPELDHYYAFNIKNGDHFELNHTANWVLEKIGQSVTLAELRPEFAKRFELNPEIAEKDLAEVIRFGIENQIIKEVQV